MRGREGGVVNQDSYYSSNLPFFTSSTFSLMIFCLGSFGSILFDNLSYRVIARSLFPRFKFSSAKISTSSYEKDRSVGC